LVPLDAVVTIAPVSAYRPRAAEHTVLCMGETPVRGVALCDLSDERRVLATTDDATTIEAMLDTECCGRAVRVSAYGSFSF